MAYIHTCLHEGERHFLTLYFTYYKYLSIIYNLVEFETSLLLQFFLETSFFSCRGWRVISLVKDKQLLAEYVYFYFLTFLQNSLLPEAKDMLKYLHILRSTL